MNDTAVRAGQQVIAGFMALLLFLLLVRGLRRGVTSAVINAVLLTIPIAGFAFFAFEPEAKPYSTSIAGTAFGLLTVGAALSFWSYRVAAQIQNGIATYSMLARLRWMEIVAAACCVLAVSAYLYIFEPAFAVANLVASVLWVLVWVPHRFRRADVDVSVVVAAQPDRTWDFLVDPANARRYEEGLEEVSVVPPGPLRVGSRLKLRRRVPLMRQWLKVAELNMEMQSVITEMVPGSSYTAAGVDRAVSTMTKVQRAGSGSQIDVTTQYLFSISDGIAGGLLKLRVRIALSREVAMRSMGSLKELLSS